jgi:two-component system sensor histidine kinase KdpD
VREDLLRSAEEIDVYVVTGESGEEESRPLRLVSSGPKRRYLWAALTMVGATAMGALLFERVERTNLAMVYLLPVVVVALRWGRGPSALAAVLGVAMFDFFFVEPYLSFAVSDTEYLITFGAMLAVAVVISTLTTRLQRHAEVSAARERRTASLYALTRDLGRAKTEPELLIAAVEHLRQVFLAQVLVLLPGEDGRLEERAAETYTYRFDPREQAVAEWVFKHGQPAGATTATLPAAKGLYLPLRTANGTLGVLGLHPASEATVVEPEQMHLLETFAAQLAFALER